MTRLLLTAILALAIVSAGAMTAGSDRDAGQLQQMVKRGGFCADHRGTGQRS